MKYLILTFYFEPDLCAGSFRNTAFVKELKSHISENDTIEVITTMPNRYHTFNVSAKAYEKNGQITINRIKLSKHKSGFIDQIYSFKAYYNGVLKLTKKKKYDGIFASSSRLFTAYAGAKLSRKHNIPLYLDIRDIFSETITQVIRNNYISRLISFFVIKIEHFTINTAIHLNLVSPGFEDYFKSFYSNPISFFMNGIDEEFINNSDTNDKVKYNDKIVITYAGNIGEGQGLEKIVPYVAKKLGKKYIFRIVGDGGTKKILEKALIDNSIDNVIIEAPVSRNELIHIYNSSDFLFLHLNNYSAFEKVLPSKIFEYGAANKPIIAGVNGFAREFLKQEIPDAIIVDSCDYNTMYKKIINFKNIKINRSLFIEKYRRKVQMEGMAKSFVTMIKSKSKEV